MLTRCLGRGVDFAGCPMSILATSGNSDSGAERCRCDEYLLVLVLLLLLLPYDVEFFNTSSHGIIITRRLANGMNSPPADQPPSDADWNSTVFNVVSAALASVTGDDDIN